MVDQTPLRDPQERAERTRQRGEHDEGDVTPHDSPLDHGVHRTERRDTEEERDEQKPLDLRDNPVLAEDDPRHPAVNETYKADEGARPNPEAEADDEPVNPPLPYADLATAQARGNLKDDDED